jgi:predicted flap endonuclease-1-like 5' DNA nuclease/archaellum component FlaC
MSIISVVVGTFLVFAGMLIWHFLTYRDRSGEDAARLALTRDNEQLRAEVGQLQELRTSLDDRCSRQKGQLNVLQQLCDDWSANREQAERERAGLEADLRTRIEQINKHASELELEKQRRISVEDELHAKAQAQLEELANVQQNWQTEHARVETALSQRQLELESRESENKKLVKKLQDTQARAADLESQLANERRLLATARKNASGIEKEYVTLESSLSESSQLLIDARSECAAAISGREAVQESLRNLQQTHDQLKNDHKEMRDRVAALESVGRQNESLKASIAQLKQELVRVSEQRDEAAGKHQSAITTAAGLQTRIDNQEATIHGLRDSQAKAMDNLKREVTVRTQLESDFAARTAGLEEQLQMQAAALQKQIEANQQDRDQGQVALRKQLDSHSETIRQLTSEREKLSVELSGTRERIDSVSESLTEREALISKLENEVEEVGTLQVRIRELESLLQRREAEMQELNVSSEEADLLREQFSSLQDQYAIARRRQGELESSLSELETERSKDRSAERTYQGQLQQLQHKLSASADTIRNLRRERAAVLARLANYRTIVEPERSVISFTQAMELQRQQSETHDPEYGGQMTRHAKRGWVYTTQPDQRDDLKRISGIAEVLEGRLNDFGVYTFKQVMGWTPAEIEEFSQLLTFPDRIVRDDWQGQARFFYRERSSQQKSAA